MAVFKEFTSEDIKTTHDVMSMLIDVIAEDVSSSITRQKFKVFVSGGRPGSPGVTSSLYQTVWDQDYTLASANPVFDMTIGLFNACYVTASQVSVDAGTGLRNFLSNSTMCREKINNYSQFALTLLGDADEQFTVPWTEAGSTLPADTKRIDTPLFLSFKRLFSRDSIKPETFALKMFQTGVNNLKSLPTYPRFTNLDRTSTSGSAIFTDAGATLGKRTTPFGGDVATLVDSTDTTRKVGLIWYQEGKIILDCDMISSGAQFMSGTINSINENAPGGENITQKGLMVMGSDRSGNPKAKLIPDLFISGTLDNIIDHFATCRFGDDTSSIATFQNMTDIYSTLYFCRMAPEEFNYSSNPTYLDSEGRINVIDVGMGGMQEAFSFINTIAICDALGNILAVAKLSRPIEKNLAKDLTIRVRLDF